MDYKIKSPRKLIEVALPLDAINTACAYEKMPGIGAHPRGLHLWWSRKPLAAARAVIFSQLVNDPGTNIGRGFKYGVNKKEAAEKRKVLFKIIEDLVQYKNIDNEDVLNRAREEIVRSWREVCDLNKDHPQAAELFNPDDLPGFHDPFSGGGAIPLEAQRLGLKAYASDLNPVAVIITKAMIEIPPKFSGRPPVRPQDKKAKPSYSWKGSSGLGEDVRYYGQLLREEAQNRIGHLYPNIEITAQIAKDRPDLNQYVGKKLKIIAWVWARTVKSPNPAFSHVDVPLAATFVLANKEGREAYIQPVIEGDKYHFTVKMGSPPLNSEIGTRAGKSGANFLCLLSGSPISANYIRTEASAGRMSQKLMAIVAEGVRSRIYLPPDRCSENIALSAAPLWKPEIEFFKQALGFRIGNYGLSQWGDLFTPRQLIALTTLTDLVVEVRDRIRKDALATGMVDDNKGLQSNGTGATAYAEAVSVYLAFAVSRCADFSNSLTSWLPGNQKVMHLFGKQTLSMTWGYSEAAILGDTVGGFAPATEYIADCIEKLSPTTSGFAFQSSAQKQTISHLKIISTDPPYYDNIGYADLSDFFYMWLRRSLRSIFPDILSTITVPKDEELVATPGRHGGKEKAEGFFLEGMTQAMKNISTQSHPESPITIYYAFKQSETSNTSGTSSTGWETFLNAVLRAGLAIVGTWPLRSEQEYRQRNMGSNALASSIILVCRKRPDDASSISRREFLRELNAILPEALDEMTKGSGDDQSPVAPVDLSQSIIGPGMAVFSKYAAVLEADGSPMSVRTALQIINRFLAEDDFDPDTQFCLHWFEQYGWNEGRFGDADTLSRAKGTSVDGVRDAGVIESGGGIVRLLKWSEYPSDWDPRTDKRMPIWESLHHLIRAHKQAGDTEAGTLLSMIKNQGEAVRQLAYRLYTLCERKGWAEDALAYNEIITSWSGIEAASGEIPEATALPKQTELFGES